MQKTILIIHGRDTKPPRDELAALWKEALIHGVARDYPAEARRLSKIPFRIAYYGDLSNAFAAKRTGKPVEMDEMDRRITLSRLKRYRSDEFTAKTFRQLPAYNNYGETLTQGIGSVAQVFGLGRAVVERLAPDIREYWNQDSEFGMEVSERAISELKDALDNNERLLVIAHSLGAVVAWDAFWKLSRTLEYRETYGSKKIDLWMTLGSPLANATARKHLKGYHSSGEKRYPSTVNRWINVRAEGDYIAGDRACAEVYAPMLEHGLIQSIRDYSIFNLAVRKGKSNPHNSLGYLIHPVVSLSVAEWV
ncbi:MAG: alpha/beta hydrolase [Deltaproteobacteria bacterium]|nr:alpha/beta hydrolase [Deltaproteobacteria bacterium]